MMPGMNPKQMKKMMRQLGMKMDEIDATEVIIKAASGDIVVNNPQVVRMNVQGQDSFQVTGTVSADAPGEGGAEATPAISDEDIKLVEEQTGVSEERARKALEKTGGDIAKAILLLEEEE